MSRTSTAAITLTPKVPLRVRLEALATLAPQLALNADLANVTSLQTSSELRLITASVTSAGEATRILSSLPPALVALASTDPAINSPLATLTQATNLLVTADHMVLSKAVRDTMTELGLVNTAASSLSPEPSAMAITPELRTAVHGQAGDQHVLTVINGDCVDIDVMGCAGSTCEPTVELLVAALEARGFLVGEFETTSHMDPEGGHLISQAAANARSYGTTLADGALALTPHLRSRTRGQSDSRTVRNLNVGGSRG